MEPLWYRMQMNMAVYTSGGQPMVMRGARRLYRTYRAQLRPREAWAKAYRVARCAFNHWWVGSYCHNPCERGGDA